MLGSRLTDAAPPPVGKPMSWFFCLSLLLIGIPAGAEEAADYYIVSRSGADVLELPQVGAAMVVHLPRLSPIVPGKRQRNWVSIRAEVEGKTVSGWVLEGAVRQRYRAEQRASTTGMAEVLSLFGGKPQRQTAVLGVRGLEEEGASIAGGRNDAAAVEWMEDFKLSEPEVAAFIHEGDLNP